MKKFSLAFLMFCFILSSNAYAKQITINGSTTVLPISQEIVEAYSKENPNTKISLAGGGSGEGIKALLDGSADIANSSRDVKPKEVESAKAKGIELKPFIIAYDCIVPVVHPSNKVSNITLDQLKAIYEGKTTNWKELGGEDKQIIFISRDTSSGTFEVWEEKVMNKARVHPKASMQASNGAIAQIVSTNSYAIGYIGLGYVNDKVKSLTVNNVAGSKANTLNKTYPISRPLFMFTNGEPKGEVKNFIDYSLDSNKGQKLVEKINFIPISK